MSGTWHGQDVPTIAGLLDEDHSQAWAQVTTWRETYDLLTYHQDTLTRVREGLHTAWPAEHSAAAASFAEYLDQMLASMTETRTAATSNASALAGILSTLDSARVRVDGLNEVWQRYQQAERTTDPMLGNFGAPKVPDNWRSTLNTLAYREMAAADQAIAEYTARFVVPTPFEPAAKFNGFSPLLPTGAGESSATGGLAQIKRPTVSSQPDIDWMRTPPIPPLDPIRPVASRAASSTTRSPSVGEDQSRQLTHGSFRASQPPSPGVIGERTSGTGRPDSPSRGAALARSGSAIIGDSLKSLDSRSPTMHGAAAVIPRDPNASHSMRSLSGVAPSQPDAIQSGVLAEEGITRDAQQPHLPFMGGGAVNGVGAGAALPQGSTRLTLPAEEEIPWTVPHGVTPIVTAPPRRSHRFDPGPGTIGGRT